MRRIFINLIGIYQALLAPYVGAQCRFSPSCSHYACEALERHGSWRGLVLAAGRLLRCHPFCPGGLDPVP